MTYTFAMQDAHLTGEFNGSEYPHTLYTAIEEVFAFREQQAAEVLERTRRVHADGELP